VDTERRKNLWLLYKEMVTNAVRHSGCTELRVRLGVSEKGIVHLVVEDDGKGFDPGGVLRESGLKNIRERAAMLAADLKLITEPGNGTQWELQCPLWK
jgi:signal transduction histidine kinase